jgi:hypothetical protein
MTLEELRSVDPVNTKEYSSTTVVDEFTFGEVFIEDIPEDFQQAGVEFTHCGDHIEWQYASRPKVNINSDGVFVEDDVSIKAAQQQAFFALSILADEGYVSRWSKQ